ncbi:MAG: hypothetical protein RLP44_32070 [Aggregatilineales bacterium]
MAETNPKGEKPLLSWSVETLRITTFMRTTVEIPPKELWKMITGDEPEQVIEQPRTGETRLEGSFENGRLLLITTPEVVEWRLVPVVQDDSVENEIPTIGGFLENLTAFQDLGRKWLSSNYYSEASRLAFGLVLLNPVDSLSDGYSLMSNYLHDVKINTNNISDFFYQINRQRVSKVNNIQLNRLSKWTVVALRNLNFILTNLTNPNIVREDVVGHAFRLELDINTVPDKNVLLNHSNLNSIFDELVDLAKEIAEKGDIS